MNTAITETFLHARHQLKPADAVAAFIFDEHGRVLLQLRDDIPNIFFPNHWGCFGGAIEEGETKLEALYRELREELQLDFADSRVEESITMRFNPTIDSRMIDRHFFIVHSTTQQLDKLIISEGQESKLFTPDESMSLPNMTPYDKTGLWFYYNRGRIKQP